MFSICCLVVLLSVVVHGASPMFLSGGARRRVTAESVAAQSANSPLVAADPLSDGHPPDSSRLEPTPSTTSAPPSATAMSAPEPNALDGDEVSTPVDTQRMSIAQLRHLWEIGAPVVILDVRTDRTYDPSPTQARGAIRLSPDHVSERASELNLPRDAWLMAYCA